MANSQEHYNFQTDCWTGEKPRERSKGGEHLHVVPATALSRPSSSSNKCAEASSYWPVNLQVTQQ